MLALTLTADLSGVTDLRPDDSSENNFWYTFKVQCTSCREVHPNWVGISRFENNEISGSKGEANFREHSANIKNAPIAYQQASPPTRQKIIEIDCRGLEFIDFKPEGEWLATGIDSGSQFTTVDLQEGEWFDYDEKVGEEVSIKDLKWEIRRS
ncbi:MAG: hypothetical protein M1818_001864 [Claussenomyces sp. TS43310]|nr:MAG: hypothetical protein M1818_001864 [Claussenomyces sp. TS43310]